MATGHLARMASSGSRVCGSWRHRPPSARQRRQWAGQIDRLLERRVGFPARGVGRVPPRNLAAAGESLQAIAAGLRDTDLAITSRGLCEVVTLVCDPTKTLYRGSPTSAHWEALRVERLVWLPLAEAGIEHPECSPAAR